MTKTARATKTATKTVKKSPAALAREKKPKAAKVIVEETPAIIDKYMPKPTNDYASSFNWWLDTTTNENWAYAHGIFTPEECKKIIEVGSSGTEASPLTYGTVGDLNNVEESIKEVAKVRRSPVAWIRSDVPTNHWIFQRVRDAVKNINQQFFNYELTEIQSLQFTSYDGEEKGFYGKHIDMMYTGAGTRKLSVSIQLSEGSDYEGGDLLLHTRNDPERPPKQQGTAIFFPSYSLHEVTPVTKGIRYSLVAWVLGPRFK